MVVVDCVISLLLPVVAWLDVRVVAVDVVGEDEKEVEVSGDVKVWIVG